VAAKGSDGDGHEQGLQGKLGYIAPELFGGALSSPASDIYACGVMLHSLLGGTNEFQAIDVRSAEARALRHVATPLDSVRSDVSPVAAEVIAHALAKDPRARFASAAAFAGELRRAFALDLAEAREEFARVVERDFEDPAFAEKMNVLSLRQIDAAWRRQDADAPSDSLKPVRGSLPSLFPSAAAAEPTRHVRAKPSAANLPDAPMPADEQAAAPPVKAGRKTEVLIWSAALAVLVALLTVLVVVRLRPSGDQRVVYVEAQPVAQAAESPALQPEVPASTATSLDKNAPGQAAPGATQSTPTTSKLAARKLEDPGNQLTGKFAQRRADVSACFHDQTETAPAQLSIAFEVDPQGVVERADLDPQRLGATQLGKCLLGIARSTQFGPQLGYLRFRIPVNARTHKAP
jgi:hypothetical protein